MSANLHFFFFRAVIVGENWTTNMEGMAKSQFLSLSSFSVVLVVQLKL